MARADLAALLPLLIMAAAPVAIMVAISFTRSHGAALALTLFALGEALWALPGAIAVAPRQVTPLLLIDGKAILFSALILGATLVVAGLAYGQLGEREERPEEFYLLLLTAAAGSLVLVAASHIASLVLGLEMLSTALYPLIAYRRPGPRGIEAGLKYLVLAALSISCLLFGAALLYFEGGTLEFARMAAALGGAGVRPVVVAAGLALIAVGLGFKLSLAPFHLWAPDVFAGAPESAAAFIATVSKGAVFVVLLRLADGVNPGATHGLTVLLAVFALASMLVGNLQALFQDDVRRMLAGSSIAHMGYLLVAYLASGPRRFEAVAFYLSAYFAASLAAFGALALIAGSAGEVRSPPEIRGLFRRRPFPALVLAISLLSLAGLPLTAGFIAKFTLLAAGVESGLWIPVAGLIAGSVLGLVYYLRAVGALFGAAPAGEEVPAGSYPAYGYALLTALVLALLWLGVYPAWLQQAVRALALPGH
jgi:NADH-quinone oxidoreductase subunit N